SSIYLAFGQLCKPAHARAKAIRLPTSDPPVFGQGVLPVIRAHRQIPLGQASAPEDRPACRPKGSRLDQSAGSPSFFYPRLFDLASCGLKELLGFTAVRRHSYLRAARNAEARCFLSAQVRQTNCQRVSSVGIGCFG